LHTLHYYGKGTERPKLMATGRAISTSFRCIYRYSCRKRIFDTF